MGCLIWPSLIAYNLLCTCHFCCFGWEIWRKVSFSWFRSFKICVFNFLMGFDVCIWVASCLKLFLCTCIKSWNCFVSWFLHKISRFLSFQIFHWFDQSKFLSTDRNCELLCSKSFYPSRLMLLNFLPTENSQNCLRFLLDCSILIEYKCFLILISWLISFYLYPITFLWLLLIPLHSKFFLSFFESKLQGFSSTSLGKIHLPIIFFIKLHENMHFHWKFMRFSNLENFMVFSDFDCFSLKWSMGFCVCMLFTWFLWFNFFNFMDYENFRN